MHRLDALQGQVVGAAQPRGPGADDGDLLAAPRGIGHREGVPIRRSATNASGTDGDGLVDFLPAAIGLAGMGTDPANMPGSGSRSMMMARASWNLSLLDQLDVALGVDLAGQARAQGARSSFLMAKVEGMAWG